QGNSSMVHCRYRHTDGSYINPNFTNDVTACKQEQAAKQLLRDVDLQILDGRPVDAIMALICRRLAEIYGLNSDVAARMSVALGRAHDLSRLRLQGIALASVPNAIVIADRHGWIEWANDSFCRQSGYALEEIAGRTIASLFDGTP